MGLLAKKSLVELFGSSLNDLSEGIVRAVEDSFRRDGAKNPPTDFDKRHRVKICLDWAETLRGDLKWGTARIIGELTNILRAELSGTRYEPHDRLCWIPSDGR